MAINYHKPQEPLKQINKVTGDIDYVYPMTTPDQVVLEDGKRLNAFLECSVTADITDGEESETPVLTNADSLGGVLAKDYATKEYVESLLEVLENGSY